jgi:hypothetical protein
MSDKANLVDLWNMWKSKERLLLLSNDSQNLLKSHLEREAQHCLVCVVLVAILMKTLYSKYL